MAGERDRIIKLKDYLNTLGIKVNIGKTKARGHKGIFMHSFDNFRIDIAKNVNEEGIVSTLLHEFAHYVHYYYDKNLKSLDFIFENFSDEIKEELIKVTVHEIPKNFASDLYSAKNCLNSDIKVLTQIIKTDYTDFKISEKNNKIEKSIPMPFKYLLRYDNVKYFDNLLSIKNIESNSDLNELQKTYIKLKSKQRALKRINSRINRLNNYYNNPSELFARFTDAYYTKPDLAKKLAPIACSKFENSTINFLKNIDKIFS